MKNYLFQSNQSYFLQIGNNQYRVIIRHRPMEYLTNDFGLFLVNYLSKLFN
jgi:hypothetical protein